MKITVLVENTSLHPELSSEHGLSLFIETDRHTILFDMGQSDLFYHNAKRLGLDLSTVDLAILSHGHYDHGGGLRRFLACNDHAPVYVHRAAFLPHYHGAEKYIGLDPTLENENRFIRTQGDHPIDDQLCLLCFRETNRRFPLLTGSLSERVGDMLIPEDFRHEQYLMIQEGERRVLISGCSHKGILDLANYYAPDILVGGFHVSKLPLDDTLDAMARRLASYPIEYYTCHCTGTEQADFMKQRMPRLHTLSCGDCLEL